jgi:hypothetical protein
MSTNRAVAALLLCGLMAAPAAAQEKCRPFCAPSFKVEPTVTVTNLFGGARIIQADGVTTREPRETEFEVILSVGLPTRIPWLEFTVEAIFLPFERESTPELEFEANLIWLPSARTGGWLGSHVDVVDKFSPAERPTDRRAYTHKLNFEWDTSLAVFKWLPDGRWLRRLELEGSLDYVATGLPRKGDIIDGVRFLDRASPWSFSIVVVLPIASS